MTWANELLIIRRFLRDPDHNIWSNGLIQDLYNQAQNELQQRTGILETVTDIEIPPKFQWSYTQEWEYGFVTGSKYRALRNQGNNFTHCYRWEVQGYVSGSDAADEGYAYTNPWEAFTGITPNKHPEIAFPANLHSVKGFYHDSQPIPFESIKEISSQDPSWIIRSGNVIAYTIEDESTNHFILYGRPTTITWTDDAGTGMVTSVEDDTTNQETGTITQRTGSFLSSETGVAIDVIDTDDNVTIIYDVSPTEINGIGDISDFPDYLNKYIRCRVLSLAYGANTDGRIESLSQYWADRALLGLETVKRFMNNRHSDKDYRLTTQDMGARRTRKHPRLPDGYPAV